MQAMPIHGKDSGRLGADSRGYLCKDIRSSPVWAEWDIIIIIIISSSSSCCHGSTGAPVPIPAGARILATGSAPRDGLRNRVKKHPYLFGRVML